MSNELISIIIGLMTILTGAIGLSEDQFTKDLHDNVDDVSNVISGVQISSNNYNMGIIGIGQFRCDCQDAQQYISQKYQDANKDTDLDKDQRIENENYKFYLVECSKVVSQYQNGEVVDTSKMNELYNKLN